MVHHGIRSFFRNITCALREPNDLVIIFHRHGCITKGVNNVYEFVCIPFARNLKLRQKSKPIDKISMKCAKTYTVIEYEYYMRQLANI